MKCPVCNSNKKTSSKASGYSKDFVEECLECHTVWMYSYKTGLNIVYNGTHKNENI